MLTAKVIRIQAVVEGRLYNNSVSYPATQHESIFLFLTCFLWGWIIGKPLFSLMYRPFNYMKSLAAGRLGFMKKLIYRNMKFPDYFGGILEIESHVSLCDGSNQMMELVG